MLKIILSVVQVVVLAIAAYLGRDKLKKLMNNTQNTLDIDTSDLHDIDRAILKFIGDRQGLVYQSEIVKEMGLPKSTVHKALRRLVEGGYVEMQKRGRFNVVILKKTISEVSTT